MSNLEFINQARKLLTDDYKSRHTAEHNDWLAGHKNAWMQPHTIVPFPPFIVSSAIAPFKATISAPSEEDIVAKALELYNQSKPATNAPVTTEPVTTESAITEPVTAELLMTGTILKPVVESTSVPDPVLEPIVELEPELAAVPEPVLEQPVTETTVEPEIIEPVVEEVAAEPVAAPTPYVDNIYKIFQSTETPSENVKQEAADLPFADIEKALAVIPQPVEELAKVKGSGRILESVLQRLQDMKSKWATNN